MGHGRTNYACTQRGQDRPTAGSRGAELRRDEKLPGASSTRTCSGAGLRAQRVTVGRVCMVPASLEALGFYLSLCLWSAAAEPLSR